VSQDLVLGRAGASYLETECTIAGLVERVHERDVERAHVGANAEIDIGKSPGVANVELY
jgi:hypothetical protein